MQSENTVTGGGVIVKFGRPFLGRYMKMGQSRTLDGWGVQIILKKWDVLYGRSLISYNLNCILNVEPYCEYFQSAKSHTLERNWAFFLSLLFPEESNKHGLH